MVSRIALKKTVSITAKLLLFFGVFCFCFTISYQPQLSSVGIKKAQAAADGTGLLVYDEDGANNVAPRYRTWNGSDLGAESSAQDDESASDDTNHTVVAASTTRNEYIMGRLEVNGHLDIQVFNGSTWSDGTNAPANGNFTTGIGTTNDVYRGFDIVYEEDSGDAIVVYESSSAGDGLLKYRTWDGDSWSNEASIDYSGVDEGNDVARWVECEPDHGTDYIMCGWREQTNLGVYAAVWTGSAWQHITQISAENGTSTRQDFDVAWEGTSGEGIIVYGDVTGAPFVDASTYTASGGFADTTGMKDPGAAVQWLAIGSSPSNNYIAVIINDTNSTTTSDIGVEMWNGSDWSTVSNPTDDSDINNNGFAKGQDVVWEQGGGDRALFVWRDGTVSETALRYMFYDISANQWQAIEDGTQCVNTEGGVGSVEVVTALANAEDAAGPCTATLALADSFSGVRLKPDPASNKIMVLAQDLTLDLAPEAFLYNGDTNATWTQTATMSTYEADLSTGATLTTSLPTLPYDFAYRESSSTNIFTFGSQTTSVNGGTTNFHVGGGFAINRTALSTNVTSITIAEQGTVDGQANLDNIKLYYDSDTTAPYNCASESYSGSESQFGSTDADGFSSANGSSTFTGSVSITTTSTMCVYVVLDITSGAAHGETIEIQITNPNTDVVVSAGTVGPDHIRATSGTTTISVFSISGTCAQSDRSTVCDGDDGSDSIKVAYNGVVQGQSDTTIDGSWQITGLTAPSSGDVVTVFIDGAADSREAVAVTKYDGSGVMSGVILYWTHLTIGSSDNQSISNTNLSSYDYSASGNDEDIFFDVTSTSLVMDATTFNAGQSIYILASNTYAPAGTATIAGSWINAGTFTHGSSTVTLNGTTSGYIINANNGNGAFNSLTLNGSGGVWTVTSTEITIAGTLTITAGTYNGGSGRTTTLSSTGTPLSITGTFSSGTGTINYTGNGATVTCTGASYYNLDLKPSSSGAQTLCTGASQTLSVTNNLTIGNNTNAGASGATNNPTINVGGVLTVATSATFTTGSGTITLSGSGTPLSVSGTFTPATSTVSYTNTTSANITRTTYYNLDFSPASGTPTYTLLGGGTLTVSNNLTLNGVGNETVNATTNDPNIDVNGSVTIGSGDTLIASDSGSFTIAVNFTNSGTFTHSNGNVTFDTTGTSVITGSTTFYSLTSTTSTKIIQVDTTTTITTTSGGVLTLTGVTITRETGDSGSWTINHQGTESITSTTISWSACHGSSTDITALTSSSNVDGGDNGVCWIFFTGIAVSGNAYDDEATGDLAICNGSTQNISMKVGSQTLYNTSCADSGNAFSFTGVTLPAAGDIITIFMNTNGGSVGTLVDRYDGTGNVTGLFLRKDRLIIMSDDATAVTNTDLDTYDSTSGTNGQDSLV